MFVRDRNSKKWLALLSTDTTLTAEEIIKLYGRRWDIEVFFKMAKSFLNLARELQSRSFDALVAHATLVCDELRQISFTEALALLLRLLEETLNSVIGLCKEQV